jgi:hypothetical protein
MQIVEGTPSRTALCSPPAPACPAAGPP